MRRRFKLAEHVRCRTMRLVRDYVMCDRPRGSSTCPRRPNRKTVHFELIQHQLSNSRDQVNACADSSNKSESSLYGKANTALRLSAIARAAVSSPMNHFGSPLRHALLREPNLTSVVHDMAGSGEQNRQTATEWVFGKVRIGDRAVFTQPL